LNLLRVLLEEDLGADAVRLCGREPPILATAEVAASLAKALSITGPSDEVLQLAEPVLAAALHQDADNVELLDAVGTLRHFQGRNDEAIDLLRRALSATPDRVITMNNLAMFLSEGTAGQQEALQIIAKAISIGGRSPELLDTQAVIMLRQGKAVAARDLLLEVTDTAGPDPVVLLHLAGAYRQIGDVAQAREAFQQARINQLADAIMGPADRELFRQLEKEYLAK
jgi:Flp pilus assembly protein TadD